LVSSQPKAVILVHGGYVDGSGWESVYQIPRKDGYDVGVVQNAIISLTGDVAVAKLIEKAAQAR